MKFVMIAALLLLTVATGVVEAKKLLKGGLLLGALGLGLGSGILLNHGGHGGGYGGGYSHYGGYGHGYGYYGKRR